MNLDQVDLDEIADRLHEHGVWATVVQTGGGVAVLHAGAMHIVADDEDPERVMYAASLGPGDHGGGRAPSIGFVKFLNLGAHDKGETLPVELIDLAITSTDDIVALIIAQTQLPLGQSLTLRDADRVLASRDRDLWPSRTWRAPRPAMCTPQCHCQQP